MTTVAQHAGDIPAGTLRAIERDLGPAFGRDGCVPELVIDYDYHTGAIDSGRLGDHVVRVSPEQQSG